MLDQAAPRPRVRALERFDLVAARVQQRRQLVEGEHDVGAQLMLDAHRHLGGEAVFRAIDVAGEHDAVIVDDGVRGLDRLHLDGRVARIGVAGKLLREDLLEASAQGEDLEAARIRVGRAAQFMKDAKPPASSTMSEPGWR